MRDEKGVKRATNSSRVVFKYYNYNIRNTRAVESAAGRSRGKQICSIRMLIYYRRRTWHR